MFTSHKDSGDIQSYIQACIQTCNFDNRTIDVIIRSSGEIQVYGVGFKTGLIPTLLYESPENLKRPMTLSLLAILEKILNIRSSEKQSLEDLIEILQLFCQHMDS